MFYYVYAAFTENDKEVMIDSATCTIYQNGMNVDSGVMTRIANNIFYYRYDYELAGTYLARCVGSRAGADNLLDTKVFEIVEDIRPHYVDISLIDNKLAEIKSKIGTSYTDSIEQLLHELTSYSSGATPIPGLYPVTALNYHFDTRDDNSIVVDKLGNSITGAKVSFFKDGNVENPPCCVTQTHNGYWGVYVPAAVYLVRIETDGGSFEGNLEVLP